jgi:acetyl esterase/lipase
VVVSINYRLAPTSLYPSQLIDAKRALRWVKQNIEPFGGDPKFIAVAGKYLIVYSSVIYILLFSLI